MLSAVRCVVVVALTALVAACSSSEPVSILSDPEAVSIQVNGEAIGTTPTQYRFSFPDDNTRIMIRASKAGYHDRDFVLSEEQLAQLAGMIRITMEAHEKTALITSDPAQALVEIEGIEIGLTPMEFGFDFEDRSRRHVVKLSKPGYFDVAVQVTGQSEELQSGVISLALEAHEKSALITSDPGQARVEIEGIKVGLTQLEFGFDFKDRSRRHVVKLSKPGYFDAAIPVTAQSEGLQSGVINVALDENPAWKVTSESEATNRWLRIAIDPRIPYLSAWQRIIDSVTSVYDSLEQLDQQSGYLRSSSQIREFPKGPDGPFLVRTQFIGSISSQEPLTYKIKLVAQTRGKHESSESWAEFDRVFAQDAQLVEELQNRMGIK